MALSMNESNVCHLMTVEMTRNLFSPMTTRKWRQIVADKLQWNSKGNQTFLASIYLPSYLLFRMFSAKLMAHIDMLPILSKIPFVELIINFVSLALASHSVALINHTQDQWPSEALLSSLHGKFSAKNVSKSVALISRIALIFIYPEDNLQMLRREMPLTISHPINIPYNCFFSVVGKEKT